jgi:hypothetical protein
LKSLVALNHDFAGLFVFNDLTSISFRRFAAGSVSIQKAEPNRLDAGIQPCIAESLDSRFPRE